MYEECELYLKNNGNYELLSSNTIKLYRDSIVSVKATTAYVEGMDILINEDFEDAGTVLEDSEMSDTTLIRTNVDSLVFEGYGSAQLFMDTANSFFELISSEFIDINSMYNASFLELDYKCDHSFKVGVAIKNGDTGIVDRYESLQINPSDNWNKIYVYLSPQMGHGTSNDEFGIFIGTKLSSTKEHASFYFDNIKWLHEQ